MFFKVLKGRHTEPNADGKDISYTKGAVVESKRDLSKLFANKFVRVAAVEDVSIAPEVGSAVATSDGSADVGKGASIETEAPESAPKDLGRDVTNQFPKAKANGLIVYRNKSQYVVIDAENNQTVYSDKTKKTFLDWLKRYLEI